MAFSNRTGLATSLAFTIVAAAGCDLVLGHQLNQEYCKAHLADPDCQQAHPDAGSGGAAVCTADEQCTAPSGVCDVEATMTCVACTTSKHDACTGATPICVARTCQKCTQHAQCTASNVCLPEGACADEAQVAYVRSGGSGGACTRLAPCGTLDDGVKANKPIVKIGPGAVADNKTTTIDGKAVMILADPGAKLARANAGALLEIQGSGADVQIFDLELTGGTGLPNAAVSLLGVGTPRLTLTRVTIDFNQGIGVSAATGTLTMSRSTVWGNMGGGISISGAEFDITNSYVAQNGSAVSGLGGLDISQIQVAGIHRLDFNTVTMNTSSANVNTGVNCSTVTVPLSFDNNIIFGNTVAGRSAQVGGSAMCAVTYSDVGPETVSGTGNINANPMFVNSLQHDFHLVGASPARDAADPGATLATDGDGDARPQGPRSDMGADEIKP